MGQTWDQNILLQLITIASKVYDWSCVQVLEALMTYMYNGTVSVPHNKLNTFLKTAEALKIKGIVETGTSDDSAVSDTSVSPQVSPSHLSSPASLLPAQVILISDWLIQYYTHLWLVDTTFYSLLIGWQVQELLSIPLLNKHPAGNKMLVSDWLTHNYICF